jgi:alpha/beta superfamily hydrolase
VSEQLQVVSRDGLHLETTLTAPDDPKAVLVLCHPHPQMGGTMNAPLLVAVEDGLLDLGWAVLRFNFRGVGGSEGEFGLGDDEVADALGAIDLVRSRFPQLPIALAGWSFGAAVALRTLPQVPDAIACVAIAPAVEPKDGITSGAPSPETVKGATRILLVCGANDDKVAPEACRKWAEAAGATYVEVKGANHFFWARYETLTKIVVDFLEEAIGDKEEAT